MKGKGNISITVFEGVRVFSIWQGKLFKVFLRLQRELRGVRGLRMSEILSKASEAAAQSPEQSEGSSPGGSELVLGPTGDS